MNQELMISLIYGVIQGATELLPVSSSGHLLIASNLSGTEIGITEIAFIHVGTLVSILIAFRDQLKNYLNIEILKRIVISIIPAGIAGFLMELVIKNDFDLPWLITLNLIFWGIVLIFVDQIKIKPKFKNFSNLPISRALFVGLGQALALIPGTSRSGITTIFGILAGLPKKKALEFSFISGIPLISAAGALSFFKLISENHSSTGIVSILPALGSSFIIGILAAIIFRKFINKSILTVCGVYRIILGIFLIITIR